MQYGLDIRQPKNIIGIRQEFAGILGEDNPVSRLLPYFSKHSFSMFSGGAMG